MSASLSWIARSGLFGVALALGVAAGSAQARSDVAWSIGIGVPGVPGVVVGAGNVGRVYYGAPAYYPPAPVYRAPPPVYYAPPPVVYAPPPVYYGPPRGHGHAHRHWHEERRGGHRHWR